jgi:hydrogenase/urease accessory protein HupE
MMIDRARHLVAIKQLSLLTLGIALLVCVTNVFAHESRPAYLEIRQTSPQRYELIWRTPMLSGMRLPVVLRLPADARNITEPNVHELPDSLVERRIVEASSGLAGRRIEFVGLQGTITDVLVRVQTLDGLHSTLLIHPSEPWVEIAAARGPFAVAGAYLMHGVEHILLGYDHLLFVLALILIVRNTRRLVWTVTAFTIAHSITLALATLGVVHVPGPPVEATIALSIMLLASEIVLIGRGQPSLTQRWPWIVAFSFGLLHGLGFASALAEIGLPQGDIPLALFAFNVGVELGQLAFIGAVLIVFALARRLSIPAILVQRVKPLAPYAIGGVAAFWLVERVTAFVT